MPLPTHTPNPIFHITARFGGRCRDCQCEISAGDAIYFHHLTKAVWCEDCGLDYWEQEGDRAKRERSALGLEAVEEVQGD